MTTCQKCNHEVAVDSPFCANCGTPADHATAPPSNQFSDERPAWLDDPSLPPVAPPQHAEPHHNAPASPWQQGGDATVVVPPGGVPPSAGPPPFQPQHSPTTYAPGQPPVGGPQFVPASDIAGPPRRTARIVGLGLGVIGLVAIGFLGIRFATGGSSAGGASSPREVATEMVAAVNATDPLAFVSLLAPDELDGLDDLVESISEYSDDLRLGDLLDADEDSDDEVGQIEFDIEIDDIEVTLEGDDAAIVSFELSGDIDVEAGSGIFGGGDDADVRFSSRDLEGALPNGSDEVEMIVVRLDGNWYASPMLTLGHYIVENGDLPGGDYDAIGDATQRDDGADTAVEAVERFAEVLGDPDADDLAAILGGGEGRAALVFRDALDEGFREIDDSATRFEVAVDAADAGDGNVDVEELTLRVTDDFDDTEVEIEGDCIRVNEFGNRGEEQCLTDTFDLDNVGELDRRLIIQTVEEDGSRRVRLVPTITETLGRFVGLVEDRETLLAGSNLAVYDEATQVEPGTDIDITFDGQLYTVHEFEIERGETYHVTAAGDTALDIHVDQGFGLEAFLIEYGAGLNRSFRLDRDADTTFDVVSGQFTAFDDGTVRVVTYSDIDGDFENGDCRVFECLPTGEGNTTLRIRQAGRQTVDFPQRISGELGPGDLRVFEIVVDEFQIIEIDVTGASIGWDLAGEFPFDGAFDLDAGTYELIVFNTSGDDATSYTVTPAAAR